MKYPFSRSMAICSLGCALVALWDVADGKPYGVTALAIVVGIAGALSSSGEERAAMTRENLHRAAILFYRRNRFELPLMAVVLAILMALDPLPFDQLWRILALIAAGLGFAVIEIAQRLEDRQHG